MKISRAMSTQHPDNVRMPFFAENSCIHGDDEIKEAFYSFSHLNIKEQLWDIEGKESDNYVVKKLLTNYEHFFKENKLGKDFFLTYRVPNPSVEKNESKVLLETLASIPRSYDLAKQFYDEDIPPIFEVAVPMITSAGCLKRVAEYYKQIVVGKKNMRLFEGDKPLYKWIGDFKPDTIKVIPLVETNKSMLEVDKITKDFIDHQKIKDYQRVWLARSDPALNYGNISAVLLVKIALQRLHDLQEKTSVDILPILGCGSAPFRGNFKPTNMDPLLKAYSSVQTFTLQSAFRYDFPEKKVREAINLLDSTKRKSPRVIDDKKAEQIIDKISLEYQKQIRLLAPFINQMAEFIPSRRKRVLHVGLFGYSRGTDDVVLPRAIKFCAALYSAGLPPELLGLNALNEKDFELLPDLYPNFDIDLGDALKYFNEDNLNIFPKKIADDMAGVAKRFDFEAERKHKKITSIVINDFKKRNHVSLQENIVRAAGLRRFLG